jgi:hypothetical protein
MPFCARGGILIRAAEDGPVRHNPRRMSSPLKTNEIRAFESRVSHVFGMDASRTTSAIASVSERQ